MLQAGGAYNSSSNSGLTVQHLGGSNYKIVITIRGYHATYGLFGSTNYGGINWGLNSLDLNVMAQDKNGNTSYGTTGIHISETPAPLVGDIQINDSTQDLNNVTVTTSNKSVTHRVKCSVVDSSSGLQSVTMNNGYVADNPATTGNFYNFKRLYNFNDIFSNIDGNTVITVSNLRVTAVDIDNNQSQSKLGVNVTVTANDVTNPVFGSVGHDAGIKSIN